METFSSSQPVNLLFIPKLYVVFKTAENNDLDDGAEIFRNREDDLAVVKNFLAYFQSLQSFRNSSLLKVIIMRSEKSQLWTILWRLILG